MDSVYYSASAVLCARKYGVFVKNGVFVNLAQHMLRSVHAGCPLLPPCGDLEVRYNSPLDGRGRFPPQKTDYQKIALWIIIIDTFF